MSALKERFIKECIKEDGEELKVYDPINLARLIAVFAHEGQFRVNNEPYWIHPGNMHQHFKAMFSTNEYPSICYNIMSALGFPTKGVEAVIWLHDVVEDTETTQKDIREQVILVSVRSSQRHSLAADGWNADIKYAITITSICGGRNIGQRNVSCPVVNTKCRRIGRKDIACGLVFQCELHDGKRTPEVEVADRGVAAVDGDFS